ncbi:MAG: archaeal proteasome endopeptidase complex subunit alpha [Thaumarchaeota archaeon]|nr:archaeal proteasome endopeptidase complex subunit alpha [Nitrososphaerota archaeon]MCZ6616331.1 archaeal proteasome endopeptidase complex subunit alpha [Nitrososphaerota archaeon]MCZ6725050.1 archaeal proteasome endopeptidase complex subunit alpha [Nitrososphaerota archaeon]
MFPAAAGYDRAITVFSPDGRLYQVEYAIETVRRGTLAVGIRCKDGIILAVEERTRKLQNPIMSQKIFQVDDHIGVAASGYIPDARIQVDQARVIAQSNRLVYDDEVDVETVARKLADLNQQFTQYAGVRPFGVALILGGSDRNGGVLYMTDPSGTYISYDAVAIGSGSDQVTEYLEEKYDRAVSIDEGATLAVECIYLVSEDKSGTDHIRMAVVNSADKRLRLLSEEQISAYAIKARKTEGPTE